MNLRIIGDHPLAKNERGDLKSRVGTIFVRSRTLVTLPGIHATQRIAYVNDQNEARAKEGSPALTRDEERAEWANSVDLIMDHSGILIRPDPERMQQAFDADELDVSFNGIMVCRGGQIGDDRGLVDLSARDVAVTVDLHAGDATATILTNDLTYDYVKENAEYST